VSICTQCRRPLEGVNLKFLRETCGMTEDEVDRYVAEDYDTVFIPVTMPNGKNRPTPVTRSGPNILSILNCFADMQLHGGGNDVAAAYHANGLITCLGDELANRDSDFAGHLADLHKAAKP
jgi:hypothetical protein